MAEKLFTTFDINNILGIKIDRLKDWMKRGYIEASIQKATGQGTKNLFSLDDVYLIAFFQYLVKKGFSREVASARIGSIKNLVALAKGVDRIRVTKLNAPGLAKIRRVWTRLGDIDFIVLGWTADRDTADLPAIEALRFADSEDRGRIEITSEKYADVDDIILVNFRKIRSRVDLAIANN